MTELTDSEREQLFRTTAQRVSEALLGFAQKSADTFTGLELTLMCLIPLVQLAVPTIGTEQTARLLRETAARIERGEAMTVN